MTHRVFYSFHYDSDVMRVQQIRNMGVIEGDEPVSPNEWEKVWRNGDKAIERWIAESMKYRECVVVLVGAETAGRRWVKYEIEKAWQENLGLVGVHIHNLNCPRTGTSRKGANPFSQYTIENINLSNIVKCYDPNALYAYTEISENLERWVEEAISIRKKYN